MTRRGAISRERGWWLLSLGLVLVGGTGVLLPSTLGVDPAGGGATYYLEYERVEHLPANAPPHTAAPTPVGDAVERGLNGSEGAVELDRRPTETVPEHLRYRNDTYRIRLTHVDHSVNAGWLLLLAGGYALTALGCLGLLATASRRVLGRL